MCRWFPSVHVVSRVSREIVYAMTPLRVWSLILRKGLGYLYSRKSSFHDGINTRRTCLRALWWTPEGNSSGTQREVLREVPRDPTVYTVESRGLPV